MNVTFDGCEENTTTLRFGLTLSLLFLFHVRQEMRHGFLHDTRAFHNLRKEHFAFTKEVADDLHATHERPFDNLKTRFVLSSGLLDIFFYMIREPFK